VFPEFRDLISHLKNEDDHFLRLFNRHNELDQQIKNLETSAGPSGGIAIEKLKKEKLHLKDSLYQILMEASRN